MLFVLLSPIGVVLLAWALGRLYLFARARAARRSSATGGLGDAPLGPFRTSAAEDDPTPRARPGRFFTHPVFWIVYALALALGVVVGRSFLRAAKDTGPRCQSEGRCSVGVAPLGAWRTGKLFDAVADSDESCRTNVSCSALGPAPSEAASALALGVRNPPGDKTPEGCRAMCPLAGQCSVVDDNCGAKGDVDCALTEGCVLWGRCGAARGRCAPVRDEDCEASRACRVLGQCRAIGGACRSPDHLAVPSAAEWFVDGDDADLRPLVYACRSDACLIDGLCDVNEAGECVAGEDADCQASTACVTSGACRRWTDSNRAECAANCADSTLCKLDGHCVPMGEGLCGTGSARECEDSEGCRMDGRCALVDGTCQATEAICASWEGCRFDGRCRLEEGSCRLSPGACARSIPCQKLGACSESATFEGCAVAKATDCAESEVCAQYGYCTPLPIGYWPMGASRYFCFREPSKGR